MAGDNHSNGPWGSKGSNGGNSPWSGSGGKSGSSGSGGTDFEEQMRRMQEKFRNRRGGAGGPSGSGDGGKKLGLFGLPVIILVALGFWLFSGVTIVGPGQQAVVFRLGKVNRVFEPGLNFHLPKPFEAHEIVDTERSREVVIGKKKGENFMLTKDENIVDISFSVKWKVFNDNPADFLLNVRDQEAAVLMASESVMREVVGKSLLISVITDDRNLLQDEVKTQLQALLDDYRSGILVEGVQVINSNPPAEVVAAFNDVTKAELDAEATKNTALETANKIVPEARGRAQEILQQSEGYYEQVIADATGEASRFEQILAEYKIAPKVTKERMYLETTERVLEKTDNLFLDQNSGAVPYLPIGSGRNNR